MDATYLMQAVQQLKSNILLHVRHRALLQHTGEPILDEHQLFFILLPQLNGEKVTTQFEINAITVGIVHASLMEHDKIKEQHATSKEQQLTVLSGDYYSGRYYELLAHAGNIHLINMLSKGIVDRCEQEMAIYESTNQTIADWCNSLMIIETRLITQFYDAIGMSSYKPLAEAVLTSCRLQKELDAIREGRSSMFGQAMQRNLTDVEQQLQQQIKYYKEVLANSLQSSTLNKALMNYMRALIA